LNSREPIVVVAVDYDRIAWQNAGRAQELLESCFASNIAADLVLELGLPIEPDRPTNVAGVVLLGINVDFDELDSRSAEILLDPIGLHENFGVCIVHSLP